MEYWNVGAAPFGQINAYGGEFFSSLLSLKKYLSILK
jgi:hypothetical protein